MTNEKFDISAQNFLKLLKLRERTFAEHFLPTKPIKRMLTMLEKQKKKKKQKRKKKTTQPKVRVKVPTGTRAGI